ncbi:MAG TPA: aldo/keto reductase [Terriglobales bacterium]|jgi:aryl-alcohol dehydrogenase-like predicted oxidoreductase
MKYRKLGNAPIEVSEISFGCWTLGGLNWVDGVANGWANVNEEEVTAAVKTGLDAGVNHFDNADVYGNGRAERMLARVFHRLGIDSRKYVLATKVGHFPGTAEHAYTPAHIRHQCEQSLINLKRDQVDIYYFHHGNFGEGDKYLAGAVETMNDLVKEGKVRFKGLSAYSADDFERLVPVTQPHVLQSWAHALDDQMCRPGGRMDHLMKMHGLSLVAFSPLAQARLLDKYDPKNPPVFEPGDTRKNSGRFTADELAKLKPKLEKLKSRFGATTEHLASMALNYVLASPRVCCVIPGFRNEHQARCNVAASGHVLTEDDVEFVRAVLA